ncbi:hypothetical protein L210DRAFT_870522, partial [Boletus edulis BED1]
LASQGMVLEGWPPGVLMPGQLCNTSARTKGIVDLSQADHHRLHQALLDGDINIIKVEGKVLITDPLTDLLSPVIIGAPPPADSNLQNALYMYVCGYINYEGPPCLPNLAVT